MMLPALRQTIKCTCGKVKVEINSPSVLRLVCYCKDCRGYYNTLNGNADLHGNKKPPAAVLADEWGGVDWTQLYPNEIKVVEGKENLETCIIRPGSKVHRVYSTCCYTPMFCLGQTMGSALLNTNLIPDKEQIPDVQFRIIGRQALSGGGGENRPKISWSVPLSWFWVMPRRVHKDQATPAPVDSENVKVLENFKEG